jgi:hypothetical protein
LHYGIDRVIISSNLVLIFVPAPYHGFGITWQPENENGTNVWNLVTCCESQERLAYAEQR